MAVPKENWKEMRALVFSCGASHPLPIEIDPFERGHRAKNGSLEIVVGAPRCAVPKFADGKPAPCASYCLKPGRHAREQQVYEGNDLVWITLCQARLHEDAVDVTPPVVGKCPHCVEQKAYIVACRRAARLKQPIPDRSEFGERHRNEIKAKGLGETRGRVVSIRAARPSQIEPSVRCSE